jgi:hypothetical protein
VGFVVDKVALGQVFLRELRLRRKALAAKLSVFERKVVAGVIQSGSRHTLELS